MKKAVKLGIIGAGYWGSLLIKKFSLVPEAKLTVICDIKKKEYKDVKIYKDYKQVLKNNLVDAVVVATPVLTHYEIVKDSLIAGKHVFVEKPLVTKLQQASGLFDLAKRKNLILMTDYTYLYHPAIQKIKTMIDQKELGEILFIKSIRMGLELFPKGVDVIWDLAPHDISLVTYFLGKKPIKISTKTQALINKDTNDAALINLSFAKTQEARILISWLSPIKVRLLIIGGTKNTVVFDEVSDTKLQIFKTTINKSYPKHNIFQVKKKEKGIPFDKTEPLLLSCKDFLNSVIKNKEPVSGKNISLKTIEILEKIK